MSDLWIFVFIHHICHTSGLPDPGCVYCYCNSCLCHAKPSTFLVISESHHCTERIPQPNPQYMSHKFLWWLLSIKHLIQPFGLISDTVSHRCRVGQWWVPVKGPGGEACNTVWFLQRPWQPATLKSSSLSFNNTTYIFSSDWKISWCYHTAA